jgi:hypothetical protein
MISKTMDPQQKRLVYKTWNEFESHWVVGLADRLSLIKKVFHNPLFVYPGFLPLSELFQSQAELTHIPFHAIKSLEVLDLPAASHDLILFSPFLQWTQDVPGMLAQAYQALAEDGFFVACFFGQDTLIEFKAVCAALDLGYTQGLQQRFLPTIHTKDAGMLMQRAGFASPTADIEHLCFSVPTVESLLGRLRDSGVNNTKGNMHQTYIPTTLLPRAFLVEANCAYAALYPHLAGGLNVTVDLIFICGWKQSNLKAVSLPNKNQPIAL